MIQETPPKRQKKDRASARDQEKKRARQVPGPGKRGNH